MPRTRLPDDDPRRKRRPLSLEQKGKVLDMLAAGKRVVDVATFFRVNESTVRTIRRQQTNVREGLKSAIPTTAKRVKNTNNLLSIKVDNLLLLYARRQEKEGNPISRIECSLKAKELYKMVARRMGVHPIPPFKASRGWTQDFFKRHGFTHKQVQGKQMIADTTAAQDSSPILNGLTHEGGHKKDQVLSANETASHSKKVSTSTQTSEETRHASGPHMTTATSGMIESSNDCQENLSDEFKMDIKEEPLIDDQVPSSHLTSPEMDCVSSGEPGSSTEDPLKVEMKEEPLNSQSCSRPPSSTPQQDSGMGHLRKENCLVRDDQAAPATGTTVFAPIASQQAPTGPAPSLDNKGTAQRKQILSGTTTTAYRHLSQMGLSMEKRRPAIVICLNPQTPAVNAEADAPSTSTTSTGINKGSTTTPSVLSPSPQPPLQPHQKNTLGHTTTSISSPAIPEPNTLCQTLAQCPRPHQLSPSKILSLLLTFDYDDDDRYLRIHGIDSISSDDSEGLSSSDEDSEVDEGEDPQEPLGEASVFKPSWSEGANFVPHLHDFHHKRSGTTQDWPCNYQARESDFFLAFFDDEVMSFITAKTNQHYHQLLQNIDCTLPRPMLQQWNDTTPRELLVFFALTLLMPLCKKLDLQDYWSNDSLLSTPVFRKYMPRDRYLLLLRCLYFADKEHPNPEDRIWEVREIFSMLNSRYKKYFYPFQNLVIDESLALFKGRPALKQYIPKERHRSGIKIFVLCDCESGIVLDMVVYTPTDIPKVSKTDNMGMSGAIVKKIMSPYLGKGHVLYTGNRYTSPALCQFLYEHKTGSCGIVQPNRKLMPKFHGEMTHIENPSSSDTENDEKEEHVNNSRNKTQQKKKRKRRNLYIQQEQSGKVLAVKWNKGRGVHFLTTVHKGDVVYSGKEHHRTRKSIMKPDVVEGYTKNMHLVGKADSQISTFKCVTKSVKWYHKFFFHLIDITILNAYNFWLVKQEMDPTKKLTLGQFTYNVVFQLLEKFGETRNLNKGRQDRVGGSIDRHHLIYTEMDNKAKKRIRCHVCSHTTRRPRKCTRVTTKCKECNVGLCIVPCFVDYHSLKTY